MPSKSAKQHRFMLAIAHSPAFAKKAGVAQSVGKDFEKADKAKKFGMGGSPKITRGGKGMINKQETKEGSLLGYQKNVPDINLNQYSGMKKGGLTKSKETNMKKTVKKMAAGGVASSGKKAFGEHSVQKKGHTKGKEVVMAGGKGMKKGGKC